MADDNAVDVSYYALYGDDYRVPEQWHESPQARQIVGRGYAQRLKELAIEFENVDRATIAEHRLRDAAGGLIVDSYQRGFLRSVPRLGEHVAYHTTPDGSDPVVGTEVAARRRRCAANLFVDLRGGQRVRYQIDDAGKLHSPEPVLDDGLLPQMFGLGFNRGDNAAACRCLADLIIGELATIPESGGAQHWTVPNRAKSTEAEPIWTIEAGGFKFKGGALHPLNPKPLACLRVMVESKRKDSFGYSDFKEALWPNNEVYIEAPEDTIRGHLSAVRKALAAVVRDGGIELDDNPLPHKGGGWQFKLPR